MIKIAWLRFVIVAAALLGIQTATAKTVNTVYSKKILIIQKIHF